MKKRNCCSHLFTFLLALLFLVTAGVGAGGVFAAEKDDIDAALTKAAAAERLAREGRDVGDADKVAQAMALAEEAAQTLQTISQAATDAGNTELAGAALAAIQTLDGVLTQVLDAARGIMATSTDPTTVGAAREITQRAAASQGDLSATAGGLENTFGDALAGTPAGTPGEPEAFEPSTRPGFKPPVPDYQTPIQTPDQVPVEDQQAASQT